MTCFVKFSMFRKAIKQHEVFGSVIQWITVNVMDNFILLKESTDLFLHNNSMFKSANTNYTTMFFNIAHYPDILPYCSIFSNPFKFKMSSASPSRMIWSKLQTNFREAHSFSYRRSSMPVFFLVFSKTFARAKTITFITLMNASRISEKLVSTLNTIKFSKFGYGL